MISIAKKVEHVVTARQTRPHTCHWPGCELQVPEAKWGCRTHWFMLPQPLRRKLWDAYQPGQEQTLQVSREYLEAAKEIQAWISANRS